MRNPNGFGSVIKLSGKRRKPYGAMVTLGYDENGKQIRKYIGYAKTKKEATKILLEYSDNPTMYQDNFTFSDIFESWSKKHFKTISDNTIKGYLMAYRKCETLYNMNIRDIKLGHLQEVVDRLEDKYETKKLIKNLCKQMFKYAMKHDYIIKDYSQYIELGNKKVKSLHKPFTDEEISLLWNNIDNFEYVDTVLILIYTGFRISELLELKVDNINIEEGYIIGGAKTEAGKNRLVPINDKILPLIKNRLLNKKVDDYLISSKYNTKNNKMTYHYYYLYYFKPIMDKLGLNHTIHDTRHTFATLLNNSNANSTSIKKLIGHSSFITTEKIYTHKSIEELKKAINKI